VTIGSAVVPVAGLLQPAAAQTQEKKLTEPELAAFAEAVELAAAGAYQQGGARLTTPALQQAIAANMDHHQQHAARFAAGAGAKATGQPNPKLAGILDDQLRVAPDEKSAAKVFMDLENALAATHLYSLGIAQSAPALQLAASVLPVESAHAAEIGAALGLPADTAVPPFETEDKRLDPTIYNPQAEKK
jgi:hypothetical protein